MGQQPLPACRNREDSLRCCCLCFHREPCFSRLNLRLPVGQCLAQFDSRTARFCLAHLGWFAGRNALRANRNSELGKVKMTKRRLTMQSRAHTKMKMRRTVLMMMRMIMTMMMPMVKVLMIIAAVCRSSNGQQPDFRHGSLVIQWGSEWTLLRFGQWMLW